jgi:hypothetical protein
VGMDIRKEKHHAFGTTRGRRFAPIGFENSLEGFEKLWAKPRRCGWVTGWERWYWGLSPPQTIISRWPISWCEVSAGGNGFGWRRRRIGRPRWSMG